MFSKEDAENNDVQILREELGISDPKTLSIQEQFEKQAYSDDAPLPPEETLGPDENPSFEDEDIPEPQPPAAPTAPPPVHDESKQQSDDLFAHDQDLDELSKELDSAIPERSDNLDIQDLEQELDAIQSSYPAKEHPVEFKLKGTNISSLKELREYIDAQTEKNFSEEKETYPLWIKSHLYDDELAQEVSSLASKKEIIELFDAELGRLPAKKKVKKVRKPEHLNKPEEIALHFDKLHNDHKKTMEELEEIVRTRKVDDLSRRTLKKHFIIENSKLVDSLSDLIHALEIIDEKTYLEAIKDNKDEFKTWVQELAKKAAGAHLLDAHRLQESLSEEIKKHTLLIEKRIAQQQDQLKEEAQLLIEEEDEMLSKKRELADKEARLVDQERELEKRNKSFRAEVEKYHSEVNMQEQKNQTFVDEYKKKLQSLKDDQKLAEEKLSQQKDELKRKLEDVRKKELELPLKFKEEELHMNKERKDLETLKKSLDQKRKTLEQKERELDIRYDEFDLEMKKREDMVQKAIDKINALDDDIREQKEETEELKKEIDSQGFQNYLNARLKQLRNDQPLQEVHTPKQDLREKYVELFSLIDQCNEAVESKDFATAKQHYDELKTRFAEEKMAKEERDILYDAIRELYANLHLAMLG